MSSSNPSPTVDPVSIWLRSQILDSKEQKLPNDFVTKTDVAARYDGQRSVLWTSISEMGGPNRQKFISRMVKNWPYIKEKYAVVLPMHAGLISSCLCAHLIAARVNSDIFLYNPKMPFLESVRRCPKSPWVFAIYTTGLTYFAFYNLFFEKNILGEDEPCASCTLSRLSTLLVAVGNILGEDDPCASCTLSRLSTLLIAVGVLFPATTTPALSHYMHVRHNPDIPVAKNLLEFVTMIYVTSKSTWSLLPKLAVFQIVVASISTYSLLWGRNRIFHTVDIDPEILTETMLSAQKETTIKEKFNALLSKVSFLRPLLSDPTDAPPKYS
uniref:Uncharacterized protein n=1 Tax=Panagrolaimus sp. ES5 TaxID=591445 RepID=A0AC34FUY1_9BILA